MTFGSLFSCIGGMDLGLERAGMRCIWQSEIDPYASRVLAKHWPGVPNLGDITRIDWSGVRRPDLVCGGFPCQDISRAGRRAGIDGAKSGLWSELAGCLGDLRPRFAFVEQSPSLLVRGMGRVLGDLASIGYDAEWDCLPAAAFGAPHIRDRLFIVARRADPIRNPVLHDALCRRHRPSKKALRAGRAGIELSDWWAAEPGVDRVADGVPNRVDRVRCLGNAVSPIVAEWIGRRILECAR